jgi:hypothetical protein
LYVKCFCHWLFCWALRQISPQLFRIDTVHIRCCIFALRVWECLPMEGNRCHNYKLAMIYSISIPHARHKAGMYVKCSCHWLFCWALRQIILQLFRIDTVHIRCCIFALRFWANTLSWRLRVSRGADTGDATAGWFPVNSVYGYYGPEISAHVLWANIS